MHPDSTTTGSIEGPRVYPFVNLLRGYILFLVGSAVLVCLFHIISMRTGSPWSEMALDFVTEREFLLFLGIGFAAQMVDGALGMAYGVTATSFLVAMGVPPAAASAGVHVSEVFTTAISGVSHWRFGNVDFRLFKRLALPGAIGAALGAYVLSSVDASAMRPIVALYLLVMGVIIFRKAFRRTVLLKGPPPKVSLLALFGGFADASGGGGWGPVVTSTLIGSGNHPRTTIGTVNASEFLVALTASGVFTILIGMDSWPVILGLIAGGALAAPIGAYVCHRINVRVAMGVVGLLVIFLSTRTLLKAMGME